jgi:hypothetical protein
MNQVNKYYLTLQLGVEVFIGAFPIEDNDIKLNNAYAKVTGASGEALPYFKTPISQIQPWSFEGEIANIGNLAQTNVVLNTDINSGLFNSNSNGQMLNSGDTVITTTNNSFTPNSSVGSYNVVFETTANETDDNLINNQITDNYEITENIYARDNGVVLGSFHNSGDFYRALNLFDIFEDQYLYSIDVSIGGNSNVGARLRGEVYKDDGFGGFVFVAETHSFLWYELTASDISNGSVSLEFDYANAPLLEADKTYYVGVYVDSTFLGLGVVLNMSIDAHNASYVELSQSNVYQYLSNTPMIRLNFQRCASGNLPSPTVNVFSTSSATCNNNNGSASINISPNHSVVLNGETYNIHWTGPTNGNTSVTNSGLWTTTIQNLESGNYEGFVINETLEDCIDTVFFNFTIGQTAVTQDLCVVTVDEVDATHNVIVWEKPADLSAINSFLIYREITTGNFQMIGSVLVDDLSIYEDFGANPNVTSFSYKIGVLDSCGNVSDMTNFHSTIHLLYFGNGIFTWTSYEIENASNPVASYNFYRDDNGTDVFNLIQVIPGTNTTFQDPDYATYPNARYRVDVNWIGNNECTATKANINTSRSNKKGQVIGVDGIAEELAKFVNLSPVPTNDILNVKVPATMVLHNLIVRDGLGKILSQQVITNETNTINVSHFASGVYFIQIPTEHGMVTKKFVKE